MWETKHVSLRQFLGVNGDPDAPWTRMERLFYTASSIVWAEKQEKAIKDAKTQNKLASKHH